MYVIDMVFFWARTDPHRPAIIQPEIITSFKGLADAISSISNRIEGLNLDRSAPIAVSIENPVVLLSVLLALLRSGYSVAPVNRTLYPHLRGAGIKDLIYETEGQVTSGGRNIRFDGSWLPIHGSIQPVQPLWRSADTDMRDAGDVIFFTSGSTGLPKKFQQTQAGLEKRILHQNMNAIATREKALINAGLTTAYGFNTTCELLCPGKTVCFAPFGEAALQLIGSFGIDALIASPQQVLGLVALKEKMPSYDLSSLQVVLLGGASIGRNGVDRIRSTLCRNVINKYGSTEAGVAALAPVDMLPDVPGAAGFLAPWAKVEIVDEAGGVLPTGSEGIIRYRTPQFVGNSDGIDSSTSIAAGEPWFYPGDIGRITQGGVLCISGRSSDVINRGGVKVSATKIAEVLEDLPEIKEAAACGIEGKSGMEEVWVAVVPKGNINIAAIKRVLSGHEEVEVDIDEVFFVEEIPRGDLGKVQKIRLKEMLLNLKSKA